MNASFSSFINVVFPYVKMVYQSLYTFVHYLTMTIGGEDGLIDTLLTEAFPVLDDAPEWVQWLLTVIASPALSWFWNQSLLSFMIGTGIAAYLLITIVKFFTDILL